jgi:eukaryotic-like serine/threonine-protein kinase
VRADLYSLGCVAYFLLTGQMVFTETNPTALAIAHVQKTPVPPSQRTELPIPAALEAIVMQLLEKDPAKRIFSAQELSRRLRALKKDLPWCEDDAAAWWQTNLPEQRVEYVPPQETPEPSGNLSPVGIEIQAR